MNNLIGQDEARCNGWDVPRLTARLNGLTMSLKSCKGRQCSHPWESLHPDGDVNSLESAMHPQFDHFYQVEQYDVSFDHCSFGYIEDYERPLRPLPFEDQYRLYAD
jgi:N-acetylglucosamine-6-sulfatase